MVNECFYVRTIRTNSALLREAEFVGGSRYNQSQGKDYQNNNIEHGDAIRLTQTALLKDIYIKSETALHTKMDTGYNCMMSIRY